jgi:hypothetical protein
VIFPISRLAGSNVLRKRLKQLLSILSTCVVRFARSLVDVICVQLSVEPTAFVEIGIGKAIFLVLTFTVKPYDILEVKNALKSVHSLADYHISSVPPSKFHDNVSISLHITSKIFPIHNLSVIQQTRGSSGSMVTMLLAGRPDFESRCGKRFVSSLKVQTGCKAHPASYSVGCIVLSRG